MKHAVVTFLVLTMCGMPAAAQKRKRKPRPGRLTRELRKALIPGLAVHYHHQNGHTATAVNRLAALLVQAGTPPTALLPPGPFTATYQGYIKLKLKGAHYFQLVGRGFLELEVNKKTLAKGDLRSLSARRDISANLVRGYNRLVIRYRPPARGHAQFRLYWIGPEFPREPIPPNQLFTDGRNEQFLASKAISVGRSLFANRQCASCHVPKRVAFKMPEMQRDAPQLAGVTRRLNANWLQNWILQPQRLRHRATMPSLISPQTPQARQMASDIVAHLATLEASKVQPGRPTRGNKQRGEVLFEDRGCITCHRFDKPNEEDDGLDRLSLHFANAKFAKGELVRFLLQPRKHYQWSRMPQFKLTDQEAADLAAHIRTKSKGKLAMQRLAGDATRGQRWVSQLGCLSCHSPRKVKPLRSLFGNSDLAKGCLSDRGKRKVALGVPDFRLSQGQRKQLVAFIRSGSASLERVVPKEFAQRTFKEIRCNSCHYRDGQASLFPYILAEEGTQGHPMEAIPPLTWTGEKLHSSWLSKLFQGKLTARTRAHLRVKMPRFPQRGTALALGLAHQHGFFANEDQRPKFNRQMATVGKQLAAMNSGMSCNRCHPIGRIQPLAPFDARSTNFNQVGHRLRYEYYRRWMLHPQRVEPSTKMLKFAPDGKKTSLTRILQGDAHRQFEALWHYLMELKE